MKTYNFYFIDRDDNVLTEKTFECFDRKEAKELADKLFSETRQNDCVSVTFSTARDLTTYEVGDAFNIPDVGDVIVVADVERGEQSCAVCILRQLCHEELWTDNVHTNCGKGRYHYERP